MTQIERLDRLITLLIGEQQQYRSVRVPDGAEQKRELFRALVNVRAPFPASDEFLGIQDAYLREELAAKGVTQIETLTPVKRGVYLWRGDITTLAADAIVNAANSAMLGCFVPGHGCIDNAVHTYAGVQLRLECAALMRAQGGEEPVGTAKITGAYNLPCRYVLHTVGPVVNGAPSPLQQRQLAGCYRACLETAERYALSSLAFCCIATGEFHFPHRRAAEIAVDAVENYRADMRSDMKVIFNVYQKIDYDIYSELLGAGPKATE